MKVSFDFDSTLTLPTIQELAIRHIKFGDDDEHEIDLITRSDLKCLGVLINYKNYYLDNQ